MTKTEELLRLVLQTHAEDAPKIDALRMAEPMPRSRWRWVAPVVAAAVTAAGVLAFTWIGNAQSGQDVANPAGASTEVPDIRGLLGKDVGDALGLTPAPKDPDGCYAFAEYANNGWGFCYDGVLPEADVAGKEAFYLLGRQINGHAPTEAGADYLAAAIELEAMRQGSIEYDADRQEALLSALAEYEGVTETLAGLRGTPLDGPECPKPESDQGAVAQPTPDTEIPRPTSLALCRPGHGTFEIPEDDPMFGRVLKVLSISSPSEAPLGCLDYADVPVSLVATTDDGIYLVYIPEDGCGHYNAQAKKTLYTAIK
jgi:hypothetical protein